MPVDESPASSGEDGEDPEVELVEEVVSEERAVELARAELEQAVAGLLLERGDRLGGVALEDRRVPGGLVQRS